MAGGTPPSEGSRQARRPLPTAELARCRQAARHEEIARVAGLRLRLPAPAATDLFGKTDASHDRRVSRAEHAAAAKAMFRTMDRDRDGRLTRREYEAGHTRLLTKK